MKPYEASSLLVELRHAVLEDEARDQSELADLLTWLSGRHWLLLDQLARAVSRGGPPLVNGVKGWLGPNISEPTGIVAATRRSRTRPGCRRPAWRPCEGPFGVRAQPCAAGQTPTPASPHLCPGHLPGAPR
jgi:hypothetical protein